MGALKLNWGRRAVRLQIDATYLQTAVGLLASAVTTLYPFMAIAVIPLAIAVAFFGVSIDGFRIKTTRGRPLASTYWIAAGTVMMVIGVLAILWGNHLARRDPFEWRVALPGHTDTKGTLYIHSVRAESAHHMGRPLDFTRATIRSNVTGQVIPLLLSIVNEAPISPAEANPIPSDATIELNAMLYDPNVPHLEHENGMPLTQFMRDWASFSLSVTIEGRDYEHVFDEQWIKDQVSQMSPTNTTPRVTKRQ